MALKFDEKRILNSLSVPVQVIDRDFNVAFMNESARKHHATDSEPLGRPCYAVSHALDRPCWEAGPIECPVKTVFETGERRHTFHKHHYSGELIVEEIIATPLRGDTGEIECVVEEFRDVTELLELREGILSICSGCKRIRGPEGSWYVLETYFCDHTGADFSHALCPDCLESLYPELVD